MYRLLGIEGGWRARVAYLLEFAAASVITLALVSVQLAPFIEYMNNSRMQVLRHRLPVEPMPWGLFPLQAFPSLLGTPWQNYYDPVFYSVSNYFETNCTYAGLIILFLAGMAVLTIPKHRSSPVIFFAGVALVWIMIAYDVAHVGRWVTSLPVFNQAILPRGAPIWLFSLSCLAAFAIQFLVVAPRSTGVDDKPAGDSPVLALVGIWGTTLLALALIGAYCLLQFAASQANNGVGTPPARAQVQAHFALIHWRRMP